MIPDILLQKQDFRQKFSIWVKINPKIIVTKYPIFTFHIFFSNDLSAFPKHMFQNIFSIMSIWKNFPSHIFINKKRIPMLIKICLHKIYFFSKPLAMT